MESIVLRNGFARYLELDGGQGRLTPERDRIEYSIHTQKNHPLSEMIVGGFVFYSSIEP
jgi:hypothetical protein